MQTRSRKAKQLQSTEKNDASGDSDIDSDSDFSGSTHSVPSNSTDSDQAETDYSEYEPSSSRKSRAKSTKSNQINVDENMNDHIFESNNDGEKLPESIVYLQKMTDSFIKPDLRIFDVVNDEIDHKQTEQDDDEQAAIDWYLNKYTDDMIKRKHFQNVKHGMLNKEEMERLYLQREAMNEVMDKIDESIESIIESADRNIFDKIVEFIQNTYTQHQNDMDKTSMEYLWSLHQHVIPTAMLMCGQNVSDHPLHFEHLYHELQSQITPLIVRCTQDDLKKAGSFGTKMYDLQRFIVDSLFQALSDWKIRKYQASQSKHNSNKQLRKCRAKKEMNQEGIYLNMRRELKLPAMADIKNEVLRTFLFWYYKYGKLVNKYWMKQNKQQTQSKNKQIESCLNGLPKIIIMIDCIEQWSPMLLTSLIYTLHGMNENYKNLYHGDGTPYIPFVLVLGVSTTEDLLARMIEPDALRLLSVSRHYFEPSFKLYRKLAEEILIESSPILFDSCILNKLLTHYQLNDYSVSRFKDQIRYLFMSYFFNTEGSQYAAYLMYLKEKDRNNQMDADNDDDYDKFDKWWFEEEEDLICGLLETTKYNEGDAHEEMHECLRDHVFQIYSRYREALKVFKMITDHLKLKWSRTEIIAKLQDKTSLFKCLLSRVGADDHEIKISSEERKDLPERIENFKECHYVYKILEQRTKRFDAEFATKAAEQYKMIMDENERKRQPQNNEDHNRNHNKRTRKGALGSKKARLQLKRQLTDQTKKKLYNEARRNLFKLLQTFINTHLKPMNELPLHQVFVYQNETAFCEDMFPPTANMIRKRFENSYQFFGNGDDVEPEPMSCIYDVYRSAEHYVNLYDGYIAFKAQFAESDQDDDLDDDDDENNRKKKRGRNRNSKEEMSTDDEADDEDNDNVNVSEKEKMNQIQYRMSVDDLKFCGFIKATNRKKQALQKMAVVL